MKKRIFSLLLVVAMLASMLVLPTYATEEQTHTEAGYCQHCKTVIPEDEWIAWNPDDAGPRTGHYYLTGDDSTQAKQITINLDDDLYRNVICLDLRGRNYRVEGLRPFLIYGIFSIMDSVGGGEITVTGAVKNASGGFCQLYKSKNSKDGSGELNLYSGTIRKVNTDTEIVAYGGLIYAAAGATFNMYGGMLIGGTVDSRLNSSGSRIKALGGTIHASASYVNLYGGTVTGGVANDGFVTEADGTVTEYSAAGGNIYAEKASKILIDGGSVENGYSETSGGNIELQSSTLEIRSGSVLGGYSAGASGNINIGGTSTFIMSGGVIKNGVCKTTGGNLRVNNTGATLDISGGEIYGDIYANLYKSFTLSGAPKIYMGLSNGLLLAKTTSANQSKENKLTVSGLTEGADIYLDGNRWDPVFTEVLENPETYLAYFKDAIRADISVDDTGALKVEQGTTGFCPHCWDAGEQVQWTEWHNKSNTSTSTITETESNHYYLTNDITRKGIVIIGKSKTVLDNDVVFDMAGNTWTTYDKKLFNLYSQLSLLDSVGNGKLCSTGHDSANGGVIMGTGTGIFNMYSGTLARTVTDGEELKGILVGGILYAPSGSQTNIYGGIIRDGISASISESDNYCRGGNIYAAGSFTMTAGAVVGGKAYTNSYIKQDTTNPVLVEDKNGNMVVTARVGQGGNLYLGGKATITGGHILGGNATYGGNVYISSGATPSISDCVIRGGLADATAGVKDETLSLSMLGGNLYVTGSSSNRQSLTVANTILRNGTAADSGGNIYAAYTDLTLTGTVLSDGTAGLASDDDGRGGNLYLTGTTTCEMYDTTLDNGYARFHGGNLYGPSGVKLTMHSGLLIGGEAGTYGGNMYCNGLTMYSGIITGGISGNNGGNIYVYEGEENYLNIAATADAPAPIISNGKGGALGGNIALSKNTTGTITGAIIENGNGDTGSKSSFNADNIFANVGTTLTVTDTVIRGIQADGTSGNGIYAGGELILKGATTVTNEEKASCVYIASAGALTVDAGFTGETSVAFEDAHFTNPEEPQGGTVAAQNTATGVFTGKLLLEGYKGRDYSLPAIFAEEGDTKLYIASTAVVDPAKDTVVWYRDNDAAAADLTESSYLKLYKTENAMNLNGDLMIDLNGKNLTVTGDGTIYGFDSKNDDYTSFGTLTATDSQVSVAPMHMAPNGRRYITVESETGTSFHRLGIAITGVALRPADAGIYYKATWQCDDILKAKIESFGIAVSTENMPKADFASDADTLYTAMAAEEFVSGQAVTSAMITGIVKTGEDNQTRGTMPIYAAPYAVIDGMTIVADDNAPTMGGVIYSMKTVLQSINRVWPKLTETQQQGVRELYAIDDAAMDTWDLYHITGDINGTPAIRPLKILTLGHSLTVDSCHMLNLVAAAEGYDQPFTIATLYESGCKLSEHVEYLTKDAPKYNLYLSSTETPDEPPIILYNYTMQKALAYEDWDIVIMQGGVFEVAREKSFTNGNIEIIKDYVKAHVTNPNFIFAWHMPWVTPLDNDLRDMYPYSPNSYYTTYASEFNDDRSVFFGATMNCAEKYIVPDSDYIYLIPSGTAIENALSSYLVEKDLHRDYAHASDLGRVIASYTWYCTLTGIDQLDEIKLDAIPVAFFKSTKGTEDRVLTDMEKAIILESVNNALANRLRMTQSQYTEAP